MTERLRDVGLDPLTWTFARLFGRQLRRDVRELPDLPANHAWRHHAEPAGRARPVRVLTKARCLGVVVSVLPRAGRVEYLVDDGTDLVKAVLWDAPERADVGLGDLVEVEGKLNANTSFEGADSAHPRELRVIRMSRVEDPNEEALHWAQVVELTRSYYLASESVRASVDAAEPSATTTPRNQRQSPSVNERWEKVGREAFFRLRVSRAAANNTNEDHQDDPRDRVLLDVLEHLVRQQEEMLGVAGAERRAVRVTFSAVLHYLSPADNKISSSEYDQKTVVRDLRFAFHTMRSVGLLFLEDEETDRHELLSYELALRPAIVEVVSGRPAGVSLADIVDVLTSRPRFRSVPLRWIEQGFRQAVEDGVVYQRPESQIVYPLGARLPRQQDNGERLEE